MNASQVKSLINNKKDDRYSVGSGLYLRVTKVGIGCWAVRYSIYGKRREITIGRHPAMSMAKANLDAAQIKLDVSEGQIG